MSKVDEPAAAPILPIAAGPTSPNPVSDPSRGARAGDYAVLLLLPFALLALDPTWIVSDLENDPWIYFGYYLNLPNQLRAFHEYYGDRLTVIVPGYLVYRILPGLAANFALHLTLYTAAVVAFYELLRHTLSRRAALLTTLMMGSHPFFLRAIGHDYVDGYAFVYLTAAYAFLEVAARSNRWPLWLILAGGSSAALVVTYPLFVLFLPFLGAFFLVVNRGHGRRIVASVSWFGAGAVALLSVCIFVTRAVAGSWSFLAPTLQFMARSTVASESRPNPFIAAAVTWIPYAVWLIVPLAACLGALAWLVRARRDSTWGISDYYQVQMLTLAGIFGLYAAFKGGGLLQGYYYASLLLPAAFMALGAHLKRLTERLSPRHFQVLIATALAVLIGFGPLARLVGSRIETGLPPLLWAGLPVVALLLVLVERRPSLKSGVLLIVLFGLINAVAQEGFQLGKSLSIFERDPDEFRRVHLREPARRIWSFADRMHDYDRVRLDVFRAMDAGTRALLARNRDGRLYFWFDLAERHGILFNNLACTQTWGKRTFNLDFPRVKDGRLLNDDPLGDGSTLVLFSERPAAGEIARAALERIGLKARVAEHQRIEAGTIAFTLTFLEITEDRSVEARRRRLRALTGPVLRLGAHPSDDTQSGTPPGKRGEER